MNDRRKFIKTFCGLAAIPLVPTSILASNSFENEKIRWLNLNRELLKVYKKCVLLDLVGDVPDAISCDFVESTLTKYLEILQTPFNIYKSAVVCDATNNTPSRINSGRYLTTYVWVMHNESTSVYRFPFQYVENVVEVRSEKLRYPCVTQSIV